ncbi:MAG: tetratricopeptide repeat protein [Deltaproteobacteria bacterium]|nr:tetratricopeptide repeat protein [Deltaproteobacteria bacterium]
MIAALVGAAVPAGANSRSQALYAKGLVPFHNGRWDDAYKLFDEAVKADANDAMALYYRGLTAARRGQPNLAIADLERAAQLRPQITHLALDLGITHFDAGQYPEAQRWLEQAYGTAADRFAAAFFLGLTHFRREDFAKARAYLAEAERDPDLRAQAHYYAGLALLRQGHETEGRAALQKAAQGRPDTETARAAQGYLGAAAEVRKPPTPRAAAAKPWSLHGSAGVEFDSNVILAPSDSSVSSTDTGQDDGRGILGLGGRYHLLDSDAAQVSASYDLSQSIHMQHTGFDLQGHRVRLQGVTSQGPVQLGLAGTYNFYALNYRTFFQEALFTPWVTLPEGDAASTQVYYTFRGRDFFRYPYNTDRDSMDHALGVRQYSLLGAPDRLLSFGYQFDYDDPLRDTRGGDDFQNKAHQLEVAVSSPVADLGTAQLSYLFRLEDYQFPNTRTQVVVVDPITQVPTVVFDGLRRHDNQHEFTVVFSRDLSEHLQLSLAYLGVLNNSNIADFDYSRHILSAGVRVQY